MGRYTLEASLQWSVTNGDCLELLKSLPSGSVDAVVTDPPYGTTNASWDIWAMTPEWWAEIWRITKPDSAVVVTICGKALVRLFAEAGQWYKYKIVWDRVSKVTGVLDANRRPLRRHEDICVFSKNQLPKFRPIKEPARYRIDGGKASSKNVAKSVLYSRIKRRFDWVEDGTRFPVDVQDIEPLDSRLRDHPTQKPTELMEKLISWYTDTDATVLDPFTGSGTTGVACMQTGRNFIGYEIDPKYCEIARRRIEAAVPLFAEATNA